MSKSLTNMTNEELWQLFPVMLKAHDPDWKAWYAQEEKNLTEIIEKRSIKRINHIGSTAVTGLIAKPTIDILLEICCDCNTNKLIRALQKNDYIYTPQPENPPPHMMFLKGYTNQGFAKKVFHLHIRYSDDWDELYFRDYLQANKDAADEYGQLKISLKNKFKHDRDGYTKAKTQFINEYTAIAKDIFRGKYTPAIKSY